VPSKALIRSAKLAHQIRHADRYGLEPQVPAIPFKSIMARVRSVIETIAPHDSAARYAGLGVDVLEGHATLIDPWTVDIALTAGGTRRLTARSFVIAAGAAPIVPAIPGLEDSGYVTSDTLWDRFAQLDAPPRRLLVLGGGPVGCELAQCFARLGSRVTVVEGGARLLPREDEEISALVRDMLEREGVTVLLGHRALRCERSGEHKRLIVDRASAIDGSEATYGGDATRAIEFDELLCAVGRAARLEGYGLQALGVATEKTIVTNEYLETLYPNIFAAGDVAGPYQLTHVASHQAWYATVNALFGRFKRFKVDYSAVPWMTFTDPEVARVGLNERDARAGGIAYEVTRWELHELDRAITDGRGDGLIKVLSVPGKDRILGVTLVGEHAGELIAEWVLAMKAGLGMNAILGTIHAYPTLAEANKYAAGEWKRAHAPRRLLGWAARYHAWRRG
jgi:pyruvate/2-oxoglutarate dehydrogenase complex dihydrolipoamide dehydrogenase (E3) component